MTTKQKLEQLGWEIIHDDKLIIFRKDYFDIVYIGVKRFEIDTPEIYRLDFEELQLILDYIKEQEL